jgi:hypothetical protein
MAVMIFSGIEFADLHDLVGVEAMRQFGIRDLVVAVGINDEQPFVAVEAAQVFSFPFGIETAKGGVEPEFAAAERGLARLLEFDGPDGIFRDLVAQAAAVLDLLFLEIKVEFLVPCRAAGAEDTLTTSASPLALADR